MNRCSAVELTRACQLSISMSVGSVSSMYTQETSASAHLWGRGSTALHVTLTSWGEKWQMGGVVAKVCTWLVEIWRPWKSKVSVSAQRCPFPDHSLLEFPGPGHLVAHTLFLYNLLPIKWQCSRTPLFFFIFFLLFQKNSHFFDENLFPFIKNNEIFINNLEVYKKGKKKSWSYRTRDNCLVLTLISAKHCLCKSMFSIAVNGLHGNDFVSCNLSLRLRLFQTRKF